MTPKFQRCSGYKGYWACGEDYPDHQVPVGEFGPHGDGLQDLCRRDRRYSNSINNPAYNARVSAAEKLAKEIGLVRSQKEWRALTSEQRDEVYVLVDATPHSCERSSLAVASGNSNVIQLSSYRRDNGLPQGIVTPSEKKVRKATTGIKYTKQGWIYAAVDHMKKPGYRKLGKTNDLNKRLGGLNTAGDFEFEYFLEVQDAKQAEGMVHEHLESSHYLREWYTVSLEDAVEVMDAVADVVNDSDWEGILDLGDARE